MGPAAPRRLRRSFLIVVLFGALLAPAGLSETSVDSQSMQPLSFPGTPGRIAVSLLDNVVTEDPDTGIDIATVATHGVDEQFDRPLWSPDGTQLAYIVREFAPTWELRVVDSDGTDDHLVTNIPQSSEGYSWSGDGQQLVYSANDLFVVKADGLSAPVNITNTPNDFEIYPTWSALDRIAYLRAPSAGLVEIQSAAPNSVTNPTALTDVETELVVSHIEPLFQIPFTFMSWSPDGTQLLLSSEGTTNVEAGLHILEADGSETITDLQEDALDWQPTIAGWSPDGQRICYTGAEDNGGVVTEFADGAVRVMNADGTGEHGVELGGTFFDSTQVEGCDWGVKTVGPAPPVSATILKALSVGRPGPSSQAALDLIIQGADPVNMVFGNFTTSNTDLSMPSPGIPVSMTRSYNSAVPEDGILGFGWSITYDMEIATSTATEVVVRHGDGRHDHYDVDGFGQPIEPPGSVQRLTKNVDGSFDLTGDDDLTFHFSPDLKLATITDPNGNQQTLSYNGDLWTGVEDPVGRDWTIAYNVDDRIEEITDPAGRSVSYAYDTNGDLVTVTNVMGDDTTYAYDSEHRMTESTDANDHLIIDNTYTDGRVTEQIDARGVHLFQYLEGETRYTDAEGGLWVTQYDPSNDYHVTARTDPIGATVSFDYNPQGLVETTTDAKDNEKTFIYDARHNTTSVTDRLGHTSELVWDGDDNLISASDALDREATYVYDANGNLEAETDADGNTTTYDYNAAGQPILVTDALGRETALAYDSLGQLTTVTDALDNDILYGYDAAGRIESITDRNGNESTLTFDAADNVLTMTDQEGGVVEKTYDAVGNLTTETDPVGNTSTFAYNDANDLLSVTDAESRVYAFERDDLGRPLRTIRPDGEATTYTYDGAGRATKIETALGFETIFVYDANGNNTQMTDALNRTTLYAYDDEDRPLSVTDPAGGVTTQTYDDVGNLIEFKDPANHVTGQVFDALNRLTSITDPAGREQVITYTDTGRVDTSTNAAGQVIDFTHNDLDRLISRTAGTDTVTFEYDAAGNRIGMDDAIGDHAYSYDDANRVLAVDLPGGGANELTYSYDLAGRRTEMTQPGRTVGYEYDFTGKLTQVSIDATQAVDYAYDGAGRVATAEFGDGTLTTYDYDIDGRATSMSTKLNETSTKVLETFSYLYDAVGNRTREKTKKSQTDHVYDTLDRLRTSTYKAGKTKVKSTYSYDAAGNITVAKVGKAKTPYVYDDANTLTSAKGKPVTNDAAGRRTSSAGATYTYDALGQLTSSVIGKTTSTYTYDGDGNRVRQVVNGVTTDNIFDVTAGLPVRIAEGSVPFTYGIGLVAEGTGATARFDHTDGLGSLRFQTSAGKVSNTSRYAPFGKRTGGKTSMGFTGEPQAGSLVHLRARDYDTATGRFLTPDPLLGKASNPQSLNRYAYVTNNPATFADPSGLCPKDVCEVGLVIAGALIGGLVGGPPGALAGAGLALTALVVAPVIAEQLSGEKSTSLKGTTGKGYVPVHIPRPERVVQRCIIVDDCRASQEAGGAAKASVLAALPHNSITNPAILGIASMVAAGAGNIVAAGAGNIVAAGAGNIVAAGAGNIVAAGGGNIVAAGAGNIVAAGAGNIVAAGGGN